MTPQQNATIHALLGKLGLTNQKANIIAGITNGRTESSKELNPIEVGELIKWLQVEDKRMFDKQKEQCNQMRRKILAKAHRIGWELSDGKADVQRVNNWCIEKSYLKKPLNDYTFAELPELVSQFDKVYNYYINIIHD